MENEINVKLTKREIQYIRMFLMNADHWEGDEKDVCSSASKKFENAYKRAVFPRNHKVKQ